ncbi:MAG: toll/interleukin-1 receptor domain-containing protein [Nitrospira sp.]|nr:toll/interleukin-1 receptor domain-containing protein [Nitrospira sp.]
MKVFISYSTGDLALVQQLGEYVGRQAEVFYWDKANVPGQEVWPSIFEWIDQCDLVLAVITDTTVSRAMAVGQEIGRAKAKFKPIVPVVAPDVPSSALGFLSGVTYQQIQPENPGPAIQAIERAVLSFRQKKEAQQTLLLIGGVIALIWLTSNTG